MTSASGVGPGVNTLRAPFQLRRRQVLFVAKMQRRRLAPQSVGELMGLVRAIRAFRRLSDANQLPGYSEGIVFFLAAQPQSTVGMGDLRRFFGFGSARASRLCAALMRAGLVNIVSSADDRRLVSIQLTPRGIKLVDKTLAAMSDLT